MKICMPTQTDDGFNAVLSHHFGSAPYFSVYDTETKNLRTYKNENQHHEHGRCSPRRAVQALGVQTVIAAGLGRRALMGLNESGIRVYQTEAKNISDITDGIERHLQNEMTPDSACVHGHSHH